MPSAWCTLVTTNLMLYPTFFLLVSFLPISCTLNQLLFWCMTYPTTYRLLILLIYSFLKQASIGYCNVLNGSRTRILQIKGVAKGGGGGGPTIFRLRKRKYPLFDTVWPPLWKILATPMLQISSPVPSPLHYSADILQPNFKSLLLDNNQKRS